MNIGPINLSGSYLQTVLGTALQGTGLTSQTASSSSSGAGADSGRLSPFAQLMSTLQQLQQSNPTQYQKVTSQIATNLQSAAKTAQSDGNTAAANQLTQLSSDFSSASKSGQLPNIQDLAQAAGGHHHGHHHAQASSTDSDTSSSTSTTNQGISQLLSALQANATQNEALNPMAIIFNTLSQAGLTGATGQ
jgi:hypothetical protein